MAEFTNNFQFDYELTPKMVPKLALVRIVLWKPTCYLTTTFLHIFVMFQLKKSDILHELSQFIEPSGAKEDFYKIELYVHVQNCMN